MHKYLYELLYHGIRIMDVSDIYNIGAIGTNGINVDYSINTTGATAPSFASSMQHVVNQQQRRDHSLGGEQDEIRLIARDAQSDQHGVRFLVTPELNETRTVNYQEISEMRQAGGILIYIGTQSRTYQLTARMVSRSEREADLTFKYTHLLKSWTVPRTGGGVFIGENAPEILKLYGYGARQLRGVPVVITSLSIDYPANVSYIKTRDGSAHIPIIQNFTLSLKEARNPEEFKTFNLEQYKQGTLPNW